MAKVTVRDIISTRKNLVRFENYARRNMDNLRISGANENIAAARALLADNVEAFEDTDVSTMEIDTTEIQERIDYLTERKRDIKATRKEYRESVETMQAACDAGETDDWGDPVNEPEWEQEQVDYYTNRLVDVKADIKRLKAQL